MSDEQSKNVKSALWRGALCRCPRCGKGKLMQGYLKQVEACAQCGEPLGHIQAADGPAFFTISIAGLLLIPMLWINFLIFRDQVILSLIVMLVLITVICLAILRPIKGAFIAFEWARGARYN